MKIPNSPAIPLLLHLITIALTSAAPAPIVLSQLAINGTLGFLDLLGLNTTSPSLSTAPPPPTDLPDPYEFLPKLPSGQKPTLTIRIHGYQSANMDPTVLWNAFTSAQIDARLDHDAKAHITDTERRLFYKGFDARKEGPSAAVVFHPVQDLTEWGDWDEAATGFYQFFLDRAIDQHDGFGFLFDLIDYNLGKRLGSGSVKAIPRQPRQSK